MNKIEMKHVSAAYGSENVLHDVSFRADEGEFVAIIGPSGCGKTTLLKIINGLVTPTAGEVTVNGRNLKDCDLIQLRREIGYAVQGARLFGHMSVEDNICYVPELSGRMEQSAKKKLAERMLNLVQLPPGLRTRFPARLSGGQQQRVGIARALAAQPDLLLMDEPFGAVDEITRKGLQDELLSLHRSMKLTVIFITHDIREALKLATRIVVMQDGVILEEGTPEQLLNNPREQFVRQLLGIDEYNQR